MQMYSRISEVWNVRDHCHLDLLTVLQHRHAMKIDRCSHLSMCNAHDTFWLAHYGTHYDIYRVEWMWKKYPNMCAGCS